MKVLAKGVCAAVLLVSLSACVAGSTDAHVAAAGGMIPQFFLGLWHGLIAPITLILELINAVLPHLLPWKVRMFEQGAGVAYDLGFFLTAGGGVHIYTYGYRRRWRR